MNLFQRSPDWLRGVFALAEPEVPNRLITDGVLPTVELGRNSVWQGVQWVRDAEDVPGGSSVELISSSFDLLLGIDPLRSSYKNELRVMSISCHETLGVAGSAFLRTWPIGGAIASAVVLCDFAVAANTTISHVDMFGSLDPIIVPKGWTLAVSATGAGMSINVRWNWGIFPEGVDPR